MKKFKAFRNLNMAAIMLMTAALFTACSNNDNSIADKPSLGTDVQTVTWNSSNVSDMDTYDEYEKAGIKLACDFLSNVWYNEGGSFNEGSGITFEVYNNTGGFTFSNILGKKFIKIEMTLADSSNEWVTAANNNMLGSGWPSGTDGSIIIDKTKKITWEGKAATVDLLKNIDVEGLFLDRLNSIVFYLTE